MSTLLLKRMLKRMLLPLTAVTITSCTNFSGNDSELPASTQTSRGQHQLAAQTLHFYVEQLTRQLLSTANDIDPNKTVVVGHI